MIALILLFITLVNAYANPGHCSGDCWTHDPGLYQRVSDGKYFLFATGGGIYIRSASSLEGPWTAEGQVLPKGSSINSPGNTNLWAPDVHYLDGTYYLYYAVSTLGSQSSTIGVATSPSMEAGTWTDHGSTGISSTSASPYNAIDPNWISIGSAQYLSFGSYWDNIYQVELRSSLAKEPSSTPYQISFNGTANHRQEASFIFEHNHYYYLFTSNGIALGYTATWPPAGQEYHISVCRSTTATGGFVDKNGVSCTKSGGSILLQSHDNVYAPGGQGVIQDKKLGPVLYYHYVNKQIGYAVTDYQFGWNQLSWKNGWPSV